MQVVGEMRPVTRPGNLQHRAGWSLHQGNSPIIGVHNLLTRPFSAHNPLASDVLDDVRVGCGEAHEAIREDGHLLTVRSRSPYSLLQTYVVSSHP